MTLKRSRYRIFQCTDRGPSARGVREDREVGVEHLICFAHWNAERNPIPCRADGLGLNAIRG